MKTIYIVSPNYPPDICGIGDYTSFLYKNLQKEGIDVQIITFSKDSIGDEFVHVIKKGQEVKLSSWLNILKSPKEVNTIIFQYEAYSFSKIGIPLYLIYILTALKVRGYKLSVMFHEVATRLYTPNPKNIAVSLLQLSVAYCLTALSSIRTTSTTFNANQLRPFQFNLLPIPSNFARADNITLTNSSITVIGCFANRIDDFFAQVVDQILKNDLGIVYLIGKQNKANNEVWEKYNFYNRDRLVITGTISSTEMEDCLNKLNMFIHMEKLDPQGRGGSSLKNGSLAAALNWGLPVVTSKGDMTDVTALQNRVNILFVDNPYQVEDWVAAVKDLSTRPELKEFIQNNAFNFYKQNLSWPTITEKYISLLKYV